MIRNYRIKLSEEDFVLPEMNYNNYKSSRFVCTKSNLEEIAQQILMNQKGHNMHAKYTAVISRDNFGKGTE